MPYKILLTHVFMVILLLACGSNPTPTPGSLPSPTAIPTNTPPPITELEPGVNLLVNLMGEVTLKRTDWSDYHPTGFGMVLERGDLLKLSSGAEAQVLCDGLTLWFVSSGAPAGLNNGCPQPPEPALIRFDGNVSGTQGNHDNLPYIISPRKSTIVDDTPLLQWHQHKPTATYTVIVRGGGIDWSQEGVTGNQLQYDGPALQTGQTYLLIVEADDMASSEFEGATGLGFKLMAENDQQKLRTQIEIIQTLTLSPGAEALTLAHLYAGHDLLSEAIATLETAISAGQTAPTLHYTLAELYRESGLYLLAEPHYEITLQQAQANPELMAEAHTGLGKDL